MALISARRASGCPPRSRLAAGTTPVPSTISNSLPRASRWLTRLGPACPAKLQTNHGLFILYEQLVARAEAGSDKGIGFFVRASVAPSDRNLD